MKKQIKIWSVLLMLVLVSSYAVALQKPALQQAGPGTSTQLVISGQDVITASDTGGGRISSRDLLVIAVLGVGVLVLIAVL
jgi:hypothetical protein